MTARNLSRHSILQLAVSLGGGAIACSTSIHSADGSSEMIALVDVMHRPELCARRPDYHSAYDFDPVTASAMRRKMPNHAATDKTLVTGYHVPFPTVGHIALDGTGFRLVPVD